MHSQSILVGTSLLFGRSAMILGPKGSGTYQVAWEAVTFALPLSKGTITISMSEMNYLASIAKDEGQFACEARTLTSVDTLIKNNPDKIICVHGMESIKSHWLMYFFQRWHDGHKILFIGESCDFEPLMDRIEVVRM